MGVNGRMQGFTDSSLAHCEQLLEDGHRSISVLLMLLVGKRPTFTQVEKQNIINALNALANLQQRISKLTTNDQS